MEIVNDFNTSVKKALEEIDPNFLDYPGLVICGTHSPSNVDKMINMIRLARENEIPFLGICAGHQYASIEYARNVLNIKDATSEELDTEGTMIVKKLPKLNVGIREVNGRMESFWNNYEVDPDFEWEKPDHFITVQYHPEYNSTVKKPHPLLVKYLDLCINGSVK